MLPFVAGQLEGLSIQLESATADPVGHATDGDPGVALLLGVA
jgi:hypothetical protein